MKKLLFLGLLVLVACEQNNPAKEAAEAKLQEKFAAIEAFINSASCTEDSGCDYLPYGEKPCGRPQGYVAFSTNIDVEELKAMIADYNAEEAKYNEKYGNLSDCSVVGPPQDIFCIDGKCVIVE